MRRLLIIAVLWFVSTPLEAQNLGNSPAIAVPEARWRGSLRPLTIAQDTTWFTLHYEPDCDEPWFWDLVVRGDWIFVAASQSVQIWSKGNPSFSNGTPGRPDAVLCHPNLDGWAITDQDVFIRHVEAPRGDTDLLAIGSGAGMGMLLADTTNPLRPRVIYQDRSPVRVAEMAAVQFDGRDFLLVHGVNGPIFLYDLDQARILRDSATTCLEQSGPCNGIALGQLEDPTGNVILSRALAAFGRFAVTSGRGTARYSLENRRRTHSRHESHSNPRNTWGRHRRGGVAP